MEMILRSHPGLAVCLEERVDAFFGHGHFLGLGPRRSAARCSAPNQEGAVILEGQPKLGLHITEGNALNRYNTREGNAVMFGTWAHHSFVFNADGTISPKPNMSLVLGFAPCNFHGQKGKKRVVFVKKGSRQQLVFADFSRAVVMERHRQCLENAEQQRKQEESRRKKEEERRKQEDRRKREEADK